MASALGCAVERHTLRSLGSNLARARPPTRELFHIIPTHLMNKEIIPGRKRVFDGVLYKL